MVTAFVFFLLGGVLAALMRWQLTFPENHFLGPDQYNQFFTMHGSTMIFLFAVPMVFQGFGVYLVPLMCGARNIAFPRLNAFCYYVYLFGGLLLWVGLFCNTGADAGWFSYVPLAGPQYGIGKRVDFWAQMITFTEVSALGVADLSGYYHPPLSRSWHDPQSHADHALGKTRSLFCRDFCHASRDGR